MPRVDLSLFNINVCICSERRWRSLRDRREDVVKSGHSGGISNVLHETDREHHDEGRWRRPTKLMLDVLPPGSQAAPLGTSVPEVLLVHWRSRPALPGEVPPRPAL